MSRIYTSADQLIGKTPLLELARTEEKEALQALTVPEGAGLDGGKPLGQLELLKGVAAAEGTMANFQLLQPLRQTDLP